MVAIRPLAPGDGDELAQLFARLDADDRYRRWFAGVADVGPAVRQAVHPRAGDASLVAEVDGHVVAHATLATVDPEHAEVAFEVDPAWRRHGLAGRLLLALDREAAARGFRWLVADVLCENHDMLAVFREHAPCREHRDGSVVHLRFPVGSAHER